MHKADFAYLTWTLLIFDVHVRFGWATRLLKASISFEDFAIPVWNPQWWTKNHHWPPVPLTQRVWMRKEVLDEYGSIRLEDCNIGRLSNPVYCSCTHVFTHLGSRHAASILPHLYIFRYDKRLRTTARPRMRKDTCTVSLFGQIGTWLPYWECLEAIERLSEISLEPLNPIGSWQ